MKVYLLFAAFLFSHAALAQTAPPTRLEQIQVFTESLAKREAVIKARADQIATSRKNFSMGNPSVQRIEADQAREITELEAVCDQFFGYHVGITPPADTQITIIAKATSPLPTGDDEVIDDPETKIRWRLSWHRQREIGIGLKHVHEELDKETAKAKAAAAAATVAK